MSWRLIALTDPYKNQVIEINQDLIIGSDPNAQLVLEDMGLSRRHAALLLRDDELWIYDLNSVAGTLVNEQSVIEGQLYTDDIISLGDFSFRLTFGELGEKPKVNTERTVYQERLAKLRERDQYTQEALRNTAMAQQKSRFAMPTAPVITRQEPAEQEIDLPLLNRQPAEATQDQHYADSIQDDDQDRDETMHDQKQYHSEDDGFDDQGVPIDHSYIFQQDQAEVEQIESTNRYEVEDIASVDQYEADVPYQPDIDQTETERQYQAEAQLEDQIIEAEAEVDQQYADNSVQQDADEIADIDRESYEAYLAEYYRELEQQQPEQADESLTEQQPAEITAHRTASPAIENEDLVVDAAEQNPEQEHEWSEQQTSKSSQHSSASNKRNSYDKEPINARNQHNFPNQHIVPPKAANDETGYLDDDSALIDDQPVKRESQRPSRRQPRAETGRDRFAEMPPVSSTYRAPLKSPTVRPMPSRFDVEKTAQPQVKRRLHAGEQPPRPKLSPQPKLAPQPKLSPRSSHAESTRQLKKPAEPASARVQAQKGQSTRRMPTDNVAVSAKDRHASHLASLLEDTPLSTNDDLAYQTTRVRSTLQKTSESVVTTAPKKSEESLQTLVDNMTKRQAASLRPAKAKVSTTNMTSKKRSPHQAKTAVKGIVSVLVLIVLIVVIFWLLLVYGHGL